jgi:hypothetical protein
MADWVVTMFFSLLVLMTVVPARERRAAELLMDAAPPVGQKKAHPG